MPGIVNFFKAALARLKSIVQPVDVDAVAAVAAAAVLAKEEERRKAGQNARQARRRARKGAEKECHVTSAQCHVTSPECHVTEPEVSRDVGETSRDIAKTPEISAHPPLPLGREGASLSLLKNLDLKEREKGKGGAGERGPLPRDWEPDAEVRAIAVERLGEIGAMNLIARFREHYSDDPRLLTPRQWRRLFRDTWVKREWPNSPRLPLMQVATTTVLPAAQLPRPDDPVFAPVYKRLEAELGQAVASSWFSRGRLESIDGDVATVTLPSKFHVDWISAHHADVVSRCVSAEHAQVTRVKFAVAAAPAKEAS